MFWVNLFVSFTYHFRTPVFQHGTSLVIIITILIIRDISKRYTYSYSYS